MDFKSIKIGDRLRLTDPGNDCVEGVVDQIELGDSTYHSTLWIKCESDGVIAAFSTGGIYGERWVYGTGEDECTDEELGNYTVERLLVLRSRSNT